MHDYYAAAIYRYRRDAEGMFAEVFVSTIITAKNDLDAVKQVIVHSDADEVVIKRY
jgi:hypothetical protein